MSVTRTEANRYIQLKQMAASGGGSDPELSERVTALETEIDGDGGLSDQIDALDEQINGDSTATPPVSGIVDEIEALEVTVYGDSSTTPATKGIVDQLTADNDEPFQFAYDSTTQKYGYKVQIGGADTFVPFSTGSSLSDLNPSKTVSSQFNLSMVASTVATIPVQGYSKLWLFKSGTSTNINLHTWDDTQQSWGSGAVISVGTTPYEVVIPAGTSTIGVSKNTDVTINYALTV